MPTNKTPVFLAYLALVISPLFFSTNIIFGKAATDISPFVLACIRWSLTSAVLLVITRRYWPEMWKIAKDKWPLLLSAGFLGMFICGGIVYLALSTTSATNGTLIYTMPPVLIILIEKFWRGRELRWHETIGVILAICGVIAIITKGDFNNLLNRSFSVGDLLFVLAAVSWAFYAVLLKSASLATLPTFPLFCLVAIFGTLTLVPAALVEALNGGNLPHTPSHFWLIAGIVLLSSLIAFSTFQQGIRVLGSSIAGIFMYLLPPFGVGFAVFFLGEELQRFHFIGIAAILCGVILATFPSRFLRPKPAV